MTEIENQIEAMKEARALDPELAALNACVQRLDKLEEEALWRVLDYLVARYLNHNLEK